MKKIISSFKVPCLVVHLPISPFHFIYNYQNFLKKRADHIILLLRYLPTVFCYRRVKHKLFVLVCLSSVVNAFCSFHYSSLESCVCFSHTKLIVISQPGHVLSYLWVCVNLSIYQSPAIFQGPMQNATFSIRSSHMSPVGGNLFSTSCCPSIFDFCYLYYRSLKVICFLL